MNINGHERQCIGLKNKREQQCVWLKKLLTLDYIVMELKNLNEYINKRKRANTKNG